MSSKEPSASPKNAIGSETVSLSVPGKTFLCGEYLALVGGPSLVLATGPRFVADFEVLPRPSSGAAPFASQSPAGRWIDSHASSFANVEIRFLDPHRGLGGLGASSAQFALVYARSKSWDSLDPALVDWAALLSDYRACAFDGVGTPPSGADVVAQLVGGVTWFDGVRNVARRLQWNFGGLGFTLLRTGVKLATHEHLKKPQAAPHEALRRAVAKATTAFEESDGALLVDAVGETREALSSAGLTAEGTRSLLAEIEAAELGVEASKGCGAMGADVILLLHDVGHRQRIETWARARGLSICGTEAQLSTGFEMQVR